MIYKYKLIKSLFSHDISNIIINYNIKGIIIKKLSIH